MGKRLDPHGPTVLPRLRGNDMTTLEDMERLIATMRAQAKSLELGADALESALAPLKLLKSSGETAAAMMQAIWTPWLSPPTTKGRD